MNVPECTMACCYGTMRNLGLCNERDILLTSAITSNYANFTCKQKYNIYSIYLLHILSLMCVSITLELTNLTKKENLLPLSSFASKK